MSRACARSLDPRAPGEPFPSMVFCCCCCSCSCLRLALTSGFPPQAAPERPFAKLPGRMTSAAFLSVDEQWGEISRGAVDLVSEADLRRKLERSRVDGQAARGEGRLRPLVARPPPRPHRAAAQDAPLPASRPPGDLPDRRLHRDDRRPDRQEGDPAAALARAGARQRRDLLAPGLPHPRPRPDGGPLQQRVAVADGRRGDDPARRQVDARAHDGARGLPHPLEERAADLAPRAALPARPGQGLGRDGEAPRGRLRRRARRPRPDLQSPRRPRPDEGGGAGAAVRAHGAAPRRPRRRREDVEVARQRDRGRGPGPRDLRQDPVDPRRADVGLAAAADRPAAGRDHASASGRSAPASCTPRRSSRSSPACWSPSSTAPRRPRRPRPSSSGSSPAAACPTRSRSSSAAAARSSSSCSRRPVSCPPATRRGACSSRARSRSTARRSAPTPPELRLEPRDAPYLARVGKRRFLRLRIV